MKAWLAHLTRLPRETRDTLFLLALIGWIVLPQARDLPLWCTALVAGVIVWRGVLALRGRPLPARPWLIALLLLVLLATRLTHGTLLGQQAGVTLVVSLLALKTLELRARRDALVIFFLGFFTLLTGFFRSQSIAMALTVLPGVLGLLTALINAHRPVGPSSLRESATLALRMTLAGAPVMLALFMFFPRLAPLWGLPANDLAARSGLSASMAVGAMAELALDDGIALRVRFDGTPPRQDQLYFRGPVLSHFDGREWTARGASGIDPPLGTPPQDLNVHGAALSYEVTLEPSQHPWLLTLEATPHPPELPGRWRARPGADLQWLTLRPISELLRYRVQSWPDFDYGKDASSVRARQLVTSELQLPAGFNPRTAAMAQQLRNAAQGSDPDTTIVQAVLHQLRTGGYQYTLEPGVSGRDSADEFWFDRKAGFCEHIASAFVILMRAAGIPARIVTGYQGGELNAIDGYWTVRNADAHAWAEVWLADRGWVRVDPTGAVMPGRIGQLQRLRPPPGLVTGAIGTINPNLLRQLRATWEAVNNRWNQTILGYTQDRQLDLLRTFGFDQPDWQDLARILAGLLALTALLAAGWAHWSRTRHDPWLRLLGRARRDLQQAGLALPTTAPPRELAQRVQASHLPAELRRQLSGWLLAMERARYAPAGRPDQRTNAAMAKLGQQYRQIRWPRHA